MHEIRVAIVDDDEGMRLVLRKVLEKTAGFCLAYEADSGAQLLSLLQDAPPEVCFLDVQMPKMNGVALAQILQDISPRMVLVFATAHEEYRADAFALYAFDYLLKPFDLARISHTLSLIHERLRPQHLQEQLLTPTPPKPAPPTRLLLKNREGTFFVPLSSILLVQRENRVTVLYAQGGARHITTETLTEVESRLPPTFFRCHKCYIINLQHVESITPYGRWTHIVHLSGTTQDALITSEKYELLKERLP